MGIKKVKRASTGDTSKDSALGRVLDSLLDKQKNADAENENSNEGSTATEAPDNTSQKGSKKENTTTQGTEIPPNESNDASKKENNSANQSTTPGHDSKSSKGNDTNTEVASKNGIKSKNSNSQGSNNTSKKSNSISNENNNAKETNTSKTTNSSDANCLNSTELSNNGSWANGNGTQCSKSTTTKEPSKISKIEAKSKGFFESLITPPWLYVWAGVLALIIALVLLYCCYRLYLRLKSNKKRDMYQEIASKTKRETLGKVDLILDYDYTQARLGVEVLQLRDLKFGRNQVEEKDLEVYCRVYLLPDINKYQQTLTKSKSFSPTFNEQFYLRCVIDQLDYRKVLVRVYRHFKFVRDAPIGDAVLSLSKTDLQLGFSSIPILAHNPSLDDPLGEISVTLRYNANTQKLGVTIIECKDLKPSFGGSTDPYVKLTMKMGNKIVRKDKSDELKKTRSPYFNEVFSYKIPPNKMGLVDLLIQVKNRDLFGSSHEIGAVRFGVEPDSEKAERQWEAMITHLRKPQTQWHYLLPSQN